MTNPLRHLNRTSWILIVVILVLLATGGSYLVMRSNTPSRETGIYPDTSQSDSSSQSPAQTAPPETPPPDPSEATESFSGRIVCLPKDGDGPQTMECAIGMETADGTFYALRNNPKYDLPNDTAINVSGVLTPAGADEKYLIEGTIDVRTIEKAE